MRGIPIALVAAGLVMVGIMSTRSQSFRQSASKADGRPDIIVVLALESPYTGTARQVPRGSKLVRLLPKGEPEYLNLAPEFFAAADPQVSFDGTRVLWSGQKSADSHWQVWEMSTNGEEKHQITACPEGCFRASYLPGDQIAFTVNMKKGGASISQLGVSKRDGTQVHIITFGPGDFRLETILRDGRVLASASWPRAQAKSNARRLYTLRPDGSGLELFRDDPGAIGEATDAEELDDGTVVFINNKANSRTPILGQLSTIEHGASTEAALDTIGNEYSSPYPLNEGKLIVARWGASSGSSGRFDLYEFDLKHGALGALVLSVPGQSSSQAVPVKPRQSPRILWSTLRPESKAGYFICLDSRRTKDVPNGNPVQRIDKVRVLTLDSPSNQERQLGDAPVERDGSFYIAVPPDQPMRFELLDATGHVIKAQRSWIWSRRGEQRGCSGCHEDKAVAPENQWPLTLRRFDTPTQLGVKDSAPLAPE